jgi:hypothetical protein
MIKNFQISIFNVLNFLLILLLLSSLRNISSIYHFFVVLSFGVLFTRVIISYSIASGFIASIFYIFFFYSMWLVCWSAIYMQSLAFLPGIPRLFLVLVFSFLVFILVKKEEHFKVMLKIFLFCYVLAALSVIYQIIYGEISWFADGFVRARLDRYASILGSLTIYGSIVGYGLIMVYSTALVEKKLLLKILLFFILLSGAFFSLAKSGIVMIGLSIIIYLVFDFKSIIQRTSFKSLFYLISFLTIATLILLQSEEFRTYYNAIVTQTIGSKSILSSGTGVLMDSPSVSIESITKRLFHWSSEMLKEYGNIAYITGVGLQGGAGTLGITDNGVDFISAHNALGDLFFIGGLPYLLIFLILFFSTQLVLFVDKNDQIGRLFFMLNMLLMANAFVASGSFFHPAISLPFWISIVYANSKNSFSRIKPLTIK